MPFLHFGYFQIQSLNYLAYINQSYNQYSFNNSWKYLSLAQFIPEIYNKIIIKILRYFWGVTNIPKTAHYIFSLMDKIVEEVGEENIAQVVIDNEASFKEVGTLLMEERKHLF